MQTLSGHPRGAQPRRRGRRGADRPHTHPPTRATSPSVAPGDGRRHRAVRCGAGGRSPGGRSCSPARARAARARYERQHAVEPAHAGQFGPASTRGAGRFQTVGPIEARSPVAGSGRAAHGAAGEPPPGGGANVRAARSRRPARRRRRGPDPGAGRRRPLPSANARRDEGLRAIAARIGGWRGAAVTGARGAGSPATPPGVEHRARRRQDGRDAEGPVAARPRRPTSSSWPRASRTSARRRPVAGSCRFARARTVERHPRSRSRRTRGSWPASSAPAARRTCLFLVLASWPADRRAADGVALAARAAAKLVEKVCEAIVANDVSQPGIGFGSEENAVTVISPTAP